MVRQMLRGFPGNVDWWSARRSSRVVFQSTQVWESGAVSVAQRFHAPLGFFSHRRCCSRLRGLLMQYGWSQFAAASLRSALVQSRPDSIWLIPHEWAIFPLHCIFSRLNQSSLNVPIHVTLQDFPDSQQRQRLLGVEVTRKMASLQKTLYQFATTCDATSLPMLQELQRRTGRLGEQMLHAGLENEDFYFLEKTVPDLSLRPSLRIAYAGTIVVEEEFKAFIQILETLRYSFSSRLELCFWSAHSYRGRPWFNPSWMKELGHLPEHDLRIALRDLDWGFIPMSTNDDDPRYNRFSFPTKFITYLAAGLPILSFGHPESSLMKLTCPYQLGARFFSKDEMRAKMTTNFLQNPLMKRLVRPEIVRCSRDWFDACRTRSQLWRSAGWLTRQA